MLVSTNESEFICPLYEKDKDKYALVVSDLKYAILEDDVRTMKSIADRNKISHDSYDTWVQFFCIKQNSLECLKESLNWLAEVYSANQDIYHSWLELLLLSVDNFNLDFFKIIIETVRRTLGDDYLDCLVNPVMNRTIKALNTRKLENANLYIKFLFEIREEYSEAVFSKRVKNFFSRHEC